MNSQSARLIFPQDLLSIPYRPKLVSTGTPFTLTYDAFKQIGTVSQSAFRVTYYKYSAHSLVEFLLLLYFFFPTKWWVLLIFFITILNKMRKFMHTEVHIVCDTELLAFTVLKLFLIGNYRHRTKWCTLLPLQYSTFEHIYFRWKIENKFIARHMGQAQMRETNPGGLKNACHYLEESGPYKCIAEICH